MLNAKLILMQSLPGKVVRLWQQFVRQAAPEPVVTVMENQPWQNTAMFIYTGGHSMNKRSRFSTQVASVLTPLSPVLFYVDEENIGGALRCLYCGRGSEWVERAPGMTLP